MARKNKDNESLNALNCDNLPMTLLSGASKYFPRKRPAGVAQLVERQTLKVKVTGLNSVS